MTYEGNSFYAFYSSLGHKIELNEDDINSMVEEYYSSLSQKDKDRFIRELEDKDIQYKYDGSKRRYNPKEHIVKLFESYYDKTNIKLNTKTKVFIKIANELKITPKAVNKAYYSK